MDVVHSEGPDQNIDSCLLVQDFHNYDTYQLIEQMNGGVV